MEEILKQLAEATKANSEAIAMLTKNMNNGMHQKDPAGVHTAISLHGPAGIFQGPGLDRQVISAYVRPKGIGSILPKYPSVETNPLFGSITGFTATVGSQPAAACSDAPYGYMKGCNLSAKFGLKRFDTNTIEFDKVMLKVNRGDFTDLVLVGQLLSDMGLTPGNLNQEQVLNVITMAEMITAGVAMDREIGKDIWQGVVTQTNQFPGLDVQIATGQKDAQTNVACPALDSDVKDFNYKNVGGSDLDIVEYLSSMMWYLQYNAEQMGLDPVQWVICMKPTLWFELSAVWPCRYLTNRCKNDAGTRIGVINDNVNVMERDRMRNGMVIPINGIDYPVVVDQGIYEYNSTNSASVTKGCFASAIYAVPMTIVGNMPSTYMEYVDYRKGQPDVNLLHNMQNFFWTDDGRYSWAYDDNKWCYKLALKSEQRIILRTPQLAGKIQRVGYCPLQHLRDADPSSSYNFDGGVSLRSLSIGEPYAVWSSRS